MLKVYADVEEVQEDCKLATSFSQNKCTWQTKQQSTSCIRNKMTVTVSKQ